MYLPQYRHSGSPHDAWRQLDPSPALLEAVRAYERTLHLMHTAARSRQGGAADAVQSIPK